MFVFGKGMALSLRWMFSHPAQKTFRIRFRKGHGPVHTGGCFHGRHKKHFAFVFGKGMALCIRADIFYPAKTFRIMFELNRAFFEQHFMREATLLRRKIWIIYYIEIVK